MRISFEEIGAQFNTEFFLEEKTVFEFKSLVFVSF